MGKRAGNLLADKYEEQSSIHVTAEQQREAYGRCYANMNHAKSYHTSGPDLITNEILTYLDSAATGDLQSQLEIWSPSPNPEKVQNYPSYRPVIMTSCVVKTLERIINERLQ